MPGLLKLFCSAAHIEKRFFYAAPLMDSLDVNDTFERLITNLNMPMAKSYKCTQSTDVTTQ